MSREKQIEEMARTMCGEKEHTCQECDSYGCEFWIESSVLYNAGYRKQSEWISIDDRLPDLFHTVLVYDTHTECVRISLYRGTDEVFRNGRISHWMPFPEAPKMKGGAE